MISRFYANDSLRKELLKKLISEDEEYIQGIKAARKIQLFGLIWFIAIFMGVFVFAVLTHNFAIVNSKLLGCITVFPALICVGIGSQKKKNVKQFAGVPFAGREGEYIEFFEDAIEFGYREPWKGNKQAFPDRMCVYTIFKENLIYAEVKGDTLILTGAGQFVVYDDFKSKRVNHNDSQRKFYSDSQFPILLDFKERDEIIKQVMDMKER